MVKIHLTTRDGIDSNINGKVGISVMEAIRASGCDEIEAVCGGCCSCATCHVYVDTDRPDLLSPLTDDEDDLLDCVEDRRDNSRLSCQVMIVSELDGLKIKIAEDSEL